MILILVSAEEQVLPKALDLVVVGLGDDRPGLAVRGQQCALQPVTADAREGVHVVRVFACKVLEGLELVAVLCEIQIDSHAVAPFLSGLLKLFLPCIHATR